MDLKQKAKEAQRELSRIKATLTKEILSLSENPKIKVLSESPKCFTINFSDLGKSWSPNDHCHTYQCRLIAEKLTARTSIESIYNFLTAIIEKRNIRIQTGRYGYNVRIADRVINHIHKVTGLAY